MADPIVKFCAMYTMPIRLMDEAKARGINLLVHSELENGKVDQRAWRKAAADRGLPYVDTYLDDADADDPNLLGWIIRNSDEWNRVRGNPSVLPDVAPFVAEAQRLAALNAAKGTSKWIMANCDGQAALAALFEKPPYNGVKNGEKSLLPFLTVRSADIYPVVATAADTPEQRGRRPMDMPAKAAYRLRTWSDEIGAPPAMYAVFVEAAKGWNSPLGVTPDQMREQVAYLTGQKAFPFPSPTGKSTLTIQQPLIDILIWWTANGQSGPGWKWIAQTPEQAAAQTDITKALLPQQPSPIEPTPVPSPDAEIARLSRDLATALQEKADALRQVVDLQTQLGNANLTIKGLARIVAALNELDDARAAVVQGV
jgi:hypothetical protein